MTRDKFERSNYHRSQRGLVRYMLKGLDLSAAELLKVEPNYEKAGMVMGKRIGVSQTISQAARSRYQSAH